MTNPYRTSAPREPKAAPKRRVSWVRLGAGAALVAAVVPLRSPAAPSELRREAQRRSRAEARGVDEGAEELRLLILEEARARLLACPDAEGERCRRSVVREVFGGAGAARRRPELAVAGGRRDDPAFGP